MHKTNDTMEIIDESQNSPYRLSEEILPLDIWYKIFEPLPYQILIILESTCKVDRFDI